MNFEDLKVGMVIADRYEKRKISAIGEFDTYLYIKDDKMEDSVGYGKYLDEFRELK